jgi:hypothetical protein
VSISLHATNTGLKVEANVNILTVKGVGSSIYPRLTFQVKLNISDEVGLHLTEKIQAWSFGTLSGELHIDHEKIADIKTYSLNSIRSSKQNHPTDLYPNIEIPLDVRRLEWIEQKRSGKSFEATLRIDLHVQCFGSTQHTTEFARDFINVSSIQGDISFIVPDTQWREQVLPGLGYGKVMVVELPAVSLDACAALSHSFKALENAQKQFSFGLYDESAGSCRVALEPLIEHTDKGDGSGKTIPKLKRSWETKLGTATYQWLNSSVGAIKEATNKPHHSPNNHFDRLEAQLLLMITTALVSYAARIPT